MKKLLALLFASLLVLTACAAKDDSSKKDSENKSEESSDTASKDEGGETDSVDVDSDSSDESSKSDATFKNDKLESKDFDIELKDTKIVKASEYDEDDKPSIALIFKVKNKSDKEVTANSAFYDAFEVYQNSKDTKRDLRPGGGYQSDLYEKYEDTSTDKINKDGEVESVQFYKLKDTKTPVTVQAKDPSNYERKDIGKKEIKLN